MADALCGPSNALQSFQKHSQADRTLQQDRLVGPRQAPGQGFRSLDPRAGSLDAEFHAFENASPHSFQLEQPQPQWASYAPPGQTSVPAAMPSWATDFQSMRISNSPIPVSQFRTEAPMIKGTSGGWQQEFMSMRTRASEVATGKQPANTAMPIFQPQTHYDGAGYGQESFMMQQPSMHQQGHDYPQQVNGHEQYSDAAFEQAFQDAFREMQQPEKQADMNTNVTFDTLEHAEVLKNLDSDMTFNKDATDLIQEVSQTRIGADTIQYTEQRERTPDQDQRDANDLARVAGELVQNVSHETDEKFRNSQFLDLMRKIRDREVEVRNNDFEHIQQAQSLDTLFEGGVEDSTRQLKEHDPNTFEFPNMNDVNRPDEMLDMSPDFYTFPSDHELPRPRTQIQDLHPGGPRYPEASGAKHEVSSVANNYAVA